MQYGEAPSANVDPYSDAYNAPPSAAPADRDPPPPRGRSRSRSPAARSTTGANGTNGNRDDREYRSPPYRRRSPAPAGRRPPHAPIVRCYFTLFFYLVLDVYAHKIRQAPNPSNVLGVFGLSIRTQERDLDEEFSRFGRVEKVTIVYDQRVGPAPLCCLMSSNLSKQSDRSRGFGFIKMATVEDATRCIQELNGVVCFTLFINLFPYLRHLYLGSQWSSYSCGLLRYRPPACTHPRRIYGSPSLWGQGFLSW